MNDFNRRGFLGTLIAAVTGLFVGKRAEASANDLSKRVPQGRYVPAAKIRQGDVVAYSIPGWYGVVLDCCVWQGQRFCLLSPPQGTNYWAEESQLTRLTHVDEIKPGTTFACATQLPDPPYRFATATLCKPTQSVRTGQLLSQWNLLLSPAHESVITPAVNFNWPDRKETYLGFATNDVTVPSGSFISGQTARWEEHPRDWCWCVPEMKIEGYPVAQPIPLDVSNYGNECQQIDGTT